MAILIWFASGWGAPSWQSYLQEFEKRFANTLCKAEGYPETCLKLSGTQCKMAVRAALQKCSAQIRAPADARSLVNNELTVKKIGACVGDTLMMGRKVENLRSCQEIHPWR